MANPLKMLKLKATGIQFILEIPIEASPRIVWATILNTPAWFGFDDDRSRWPKQTFEAWPGGRWVMEHPGGPSYLFATITQVEPEKLLRLSGSMGMNHLPVSGAVIFELQPRKDGKTTLLRVGTRMFGYLDKDVKKRYQSGWKKLFAQLKSAAEGR